ncbi:Uncharacterised protein [Nocardia otitidiscaviarum]|uniref:Uncharacterized protein n=1 Tax=Nocardia otitidiscaviarum TaxID=1823 RepID=A0A378Y860_9NOCA|nr:Uncharacterised protein [Nocardia otitidiscaviarum]
MPEKSRMHACDASGLGAENRRDDRILVPAARAAVSNWTQRCAALWCVTLVVRYRNSRVGLCITL